MSKTLAWLKEFRKSPLKGNDGARQICQRQQCEAFRPMAYTNLRSVGSSKFTKSQNLRTGNICSTTTHFPPNSYWSNCSWVTGHDRLYLEQNVENWMPWDVVENIAYSETTKENLGRLLHVPGGQKGSHKTAHTCWDSVRSQSKR